MEIKNYDLFPVPITCYKNFLPTDLALNIREYILSQEHSAGPHDAITGNATSSHGHHDTFIQECTANVPGCNQFFHNTMLCLSNYASRTGAPYLYLDNSWYNIQAPGSFLNKHMHVSTGKLPFCSGALYIDVDDGSSPISFDNPNPYSYFFNYRGNMLTQYNYTYFNIKPEIGDMLIFPSWLVHSNSKENTSENRIVVSFNAGVKET